MGVHGLWELLAPVGRRVSVETLAGKRLAIDASIWIIQFMKAMRDEKGEMVRNAHVLGFFRRICKLLYLRTKPVFVFDGGTPALKRRTVIARRRQRENAQAKIRKTAEKLLLNHLKQMRLKELAEDLEKQRKENDVKGKRPIIEVPSNEKETTEKGSADVVVGYNQEELDEMLAASLAAEENEGFTRDASTSGAGVKDDEVFGDEEEDDEDEEMILPEMHGKVDPAVLAALPPSMQLDLLVQMRERLMAENRQKYQKVKKAPSRFSELQIEAYLKTVAFRREIDGVQKAASGRGIGGVQTSRIASEANREFIFSSSFTGDKQTLTSVGQERSEADQSRDPPANCSTNAANEVLSSRKSGDVAGPPAAETGKKAFHNDVETYLDERGRLRVSRSRALGIRMTRDLQRNLDLMKEIDRDEAETIHEKNSESIRTGNNPVNVPDNSSDEILNREHTDDNNDGIEKTEELGIVNGASIEISFEDTLEYENGNDDDTIFARLVAGDPVPDLSVDNSASVKQSLNSASDNEWEEGVIENTTLNEGGDEEIEWEEGFQDIQSKSSFCPNENQNIATKGALEEEANIQEAIRRSLEDTRGQRSTNDFLEDHVISKGANEMFSEDEDTVFVYEASAADVSLPDSMNALELNRAEAKSAEFVELCTEKKDVNLLNDNADGSGDTLVGSDAQPEQKGLEACSEGTNELAKEKIYGEFSIEVKSAEFVELNTEKNDSNLLSGNADGSGETPVDSDAQPEQKGLCMTDKQPLEARGEGTNELAKEKIDGEFSMENDKDQEEMIFLGKECGEQESEQRTTLDHHIPAVDSITDVDGTNKLAEEKTYGEFSMENDEVARGSSFLNDDKDREIMEDRLEEEMVFLGKEREELGSEQRKLERNSESVSGEMFAECQELLQMFGLPYIIAPMEAEAQCAFMELSNLVDGVVTDDSDAFLFGARSVYKNIFDDRKYVETYLMKDIEDELGLDREKLIHMALLLGSDYTEGISGIGIVNAIEVVNAFPGKDGLRECREWIESPDPAILGKLNVKSGGNSRKGSKGSENIPSDQNDDDKRIKQIFMDTHRNVSKNWHISTSFPSDAVVSAYAVPQVDKSTESLSWGKPDLFVLRKLCWEKFGWGTSKANELLLPVLKEYNKHETQLRLEAFYTFNEKFAKIRSKRIKKAVKGITKHKSAELMDDETPPPQKFESGKKRKDPLGVDSDNVEKLTAAKQLKRGRTKGKTSEINLEESKKGKRGGQGRGQISGRGRRKKKLSFENTEIISSDSGEEMQIDESEEACEVRRSGRLRKTVNYNVSNEIDESDKENEDRLEECSMPEESFVDRNVVGGFNQGNDGNKLNEERSDVTEGTHITNQTSASLIDDNQTDEHFKKDRFSKDYLQFGGGFCADEDEETETVTEKCDDGVDFGELLVEEKNCEENLLITTPISSSNEKTDLGCSEINMNDETRADDCEVDDDLGNRLSKSLRSMPNLRRRRKIN